MNIHSLPANGHLYNQQRDFFGDGSGLIIKSTLNCVLHDDGVGKLARRHLLSLYTRVCLKRLGRFIHEQYLGTFVLKTEA